MNPDRANRIKLFCILTAVIVPITLSTWYFGEAVQNGVTATSNKGELVIPVLDLAELPLVDADNAPAYQSFEEMTNGVNPDDYVPRPWQLIYIGGATCDAVCEERLYFLRQLHTRLGAEARRIQGVYVQADAGARELTGALAELMEREQSGMRVLYADPTALRSALARTNREGEDALDEHYVYVADPVGNIMLFFAPENTPEEILSDLKKLLDQSSLG